MEFASKNHDQGIQTHKWDKWVQFLQICSLFQIFEHFFHYDKSYQYNPYKSLQMQDYIEQM